MASLTAICVVHSLHHDAGIPGVTAIDKRAVTGAVRVRTLGVHADVQADRKHHGGVDQAVYVYAQEDADFWSDELDRVLAPGWFGENLRTVGLDVSGAMTGDRWLIGGVELEVTSARQPCQTFARWLGGADERGWVKRFAHAGRPGAYTRVIRQGELEAGDEIEVVYSPDRRGPTMAEMVRGASGV